MYLPKHFEITDRALLQDVMRRFSFALLVTVRDGSPSATHLPFLIHGDEGTHGTLVGHLARANPQCRDLGDGVEALVVFQGDHTYISPSWYDVHPSVPTWNYMVVHVRGVPRVIEDRTRVRAALRELVWQHERHFEAPWQLDALPEEYLQRMERGIVAFEIPIARLEGKFKLSQNRAVRDRELVVDALAESDDPGAIGVRAMMEALRNGE